MAPIQWKTLARRVLTKSIGVVLALLFVGTAAVLLAGPAISLMATRHGQEVEIVSISNQVGKIKTACEKGGLFKVSAKSDGQKFSGIYCLYPAWPDHLKPSAGDVIRIWPSSNPRVGSVPIFGLGWMMIGATFLTGLVILEFAFLSLTVR
jgi:hypothetical protein